MRFVLSEKAISVDVISVEDERPEELAGFNPYNQILTLVDRDLVLYEVQIIMEYLDERFPHPPLMPVDPVSRANNRLFRYRVKQDIYGLVEKLDTGTAGKTAATVRKELKDQLTSIAPLFGQMPYFLSEEFSLVDSYLVPVLWRLPHYGIELPPKQSRPLLQYAERMFNRDSFKASLSEQERDIR